MIDRRQVLVRGSAAVAMLGFGRAGPAGAAAGTGPEAAEALAALLERFADELLDDHPELVTMLGLDTGDRAAARARLEDRSAAAVARRRAGVADRRRRLAAIDRTLLEGADAVDHDHIAYHLDTLARAAAFDFGSFTEFGAGPYVVDQMEGAYFEIPDFLDTHHEIAAAVDAEAYLARLDAFAGMLDQETARLADATAMGIVPPDFILDTTLTQLRGIARGPAADSGLVRSLARRVAGTGWEGDLVDRATGIVERQILPAYSRQLAALEAQREKAGPEAGIWTLQEGAAYYAMCLRQYTTTDLSAEEIHAIGLDQVAALTAEADALLRGLGLTRGPVGARLAALARDPAHLYPDTEAGRAECLDDLNAQMAAMERRLPELFATLPQAGVEVRRVPPEIEAGAPAGYYLPGSLDGARPGIYYINLRDMSVWPRWALPTLTYHEAVPGHHLQVSLQQEVEGLPLLRKILWLAAYGEGWALYAEQLADEMGVYADDPAGRVGYLQSMLFRAARLVVDTGLHHKRWSRAQAVRYMMATLGEQESAATGEVDRYCVLPGQACAYKVGHNEWVRLRAASQRALGDRFDLRAFHDVALRSGTMPLAVLEQLVEAWRTAIRAG